MNAGEQQLEHHHVAKKVNNTKKKGEKSKEKYALLMNYSFGMPLHEDGICMI